MKTNKLLIFQYIQDAQNSGIAVFTHVIHTRKFSAGSPNEAQIVDSEVVTDINFRLARYLSAGTKIGTYEIHSAIGAGGMGEVYQAHDTKLGRDVAIKVFVD